ncbi:MAG: thioredoxin family protein [Granulosicoccus sp.]
MARAESNTMPIGTSAPAFELPDTRTNQPHVSLKDYLGNPVLIVFMCNHCPYVVHLLKPLVALASDIDKSGIKTIAISSNDVANYPDDSPELMAKLAADNNFNFPYCFDEEQTVARAFDAVCTPDIFLFDAQHKLYYHGQFDETRPKQGEAHGTDLRNACDALLRGDATPDAQQPSVGCSIKWKTA